MKKVSIKPGCIACGACQFIAPQVFSVSEVCRVKKDVDLQKYNQLIQEAVAQCPVGVIFYQKHVGSLVMKKQTKKEGDICDRQDV